MRYTMVINSDGLELESNYVTPYFDQVDHLFAIFMAQAHSLDAALDVTYDKVERSTGNLDADI